MSDIVDNLKKFVELAKARETLKKSQASKLVNPNKDLADRLHKAFGPPKITSLQAPSMANMGNIPKISSPKAPSSSNSGGIPKITTVKSEKIEKAHEDRPNIDQRYKYDMVHYSKLNDKQKAQAKAMYPHQTPVSSHVGHNKPISHENYHYQVNAKGDLSGNRHLSNKGMHEGRLSNLKDQKKPNLPKTEKAEKKVLIRPDVVSKPETFNEDGKSVSRPATLSGPTPMNVRKAEPLRKPWESEAQRRWGNSPSGKKALGAAGVHEWNEATKGKKLPEKVGKAQQQVQDKHDQIVPENYVNHELQLAEKPNDQQLYHIKDGAMRITQKPMSLKDIAAKHGPIQKLESAGFRVVPHAPEPSQPGTPLRRST